MLTMPRSMHHVSLKCLSCKLHLSHVCLSFESYISAKKPAYLACCGCLPASWHWRLCDCQTLDRQQNAARVLSGGCRPAPTPAASHNSMRTAPCLQGLSINRVQYTNYVSFIEDIHQVDGNSLAQANVSYRNSKILLEPKPWARQAMCHSKTLWTSFSSHFHHGRRLLPARIGTNIAWLYDIVTQSKRNIKGMKEKKDVKNKIRWKKEKKEKDDGRNKRREGWKEQKKNKF